MITVTAVPGALVLSRDGMSVQTDAAQLAATLTTFRNETAMKGTDMSDTRPFTRGPAKRPDPAARNLAPISKTQADAEPPRGRAFPEPYPEKTYTIHATSPHGFACELAFNDISLDQLEKLLSELVDRGWTL
jgi:hypothetical protein